MAKKINSVEAYPGRVYTLSVPLNLETTDTATYSLNLRHIRIVGVALAGTGSGIIHIWFLDGGTATISGSSSHIVARNAKRVVDIPVAQNYGANQLEFTPIDIDRGLNIFVQRDTMTFYGTFSGTLFIHYIYQP
jgi:hypothetical protein